MDFPRRFLNNWEKTKKKKNVYGINSFNIFRFYCFAITILKIIVDIRRILILAFQNMVKFIRFVELFLNITDFRVF